MFAVTQTSHYMFWLALNLLLCLLLTLWLCASAFVTDKGSSQGNFVLCWSPLKPGSRKDIDPVAIGQVSLPTLPLSLMCHGL